MGVIYKILKIILGRRKPKKRTPAPQRSMPEPEPEAEEINNDLGENNDNLSADNSSEPDNDEINQEVYHEIEPEPKKDPEPKTKTDTEKKTKPEIMTQPTYNPDVFPADEPVIILLTEFLSIRLQQMAHKDHSIVRIPVVPDWTDCGYSLSDNFSRFVHEVNEKLQETALLDSLLSYTGETSQELSTDTQPGILLHKDEILMAEKKLQSARRIAKTSLTNDEKWILIITLVPHVYPHFYNEVIARHINKPGDYPQMGFIRNGEFRGYCPTGETIFFMLAGNDFDRRIELQRLFQADQVFSKKANGMAGRFGKRRTSHEWQTGAGAGSFG